MRGTARSTCQPSPPHVFLVWIETKCNVLLINVLTEFIKLIIFDFTLPSCIWPLPPPKEGSDWEELPQPTIKINCVSARSTLFVSCLACYRWQFV